LHQHQYLLSAAATQFKEISGLPLCITEIPAVNSRKDREREVVEEEGDGRQQKLLLLPKDNQSTKDSLSSATITNLLTHNILIITTFVT
jgi:hypothetical protein